MNIPAFSLFKYIYTGYHLNDDGSLDSRVWFSLLVEANEEDNSLTYLIFPYGAEEEEIVEKKYQV